MERVIENNKLIAEFMGLTTPNKYDGGKTFAINPRTIDGEIWAESWFHPDYHTNWNSLMPVLDKIKDCIEPNAFNFSINSEWVEIRMNSQLSMVLDYPLDTIEHDGGIEGVYKSVLDFIKWHNEYLLSTDKTKTV